MCARHNGKRLKEAVIDAPAAGAGVTRAPRRRRDLTDLAGTWDAEPEVEDALVAQDEPDPNLWR